MCVRGGTVLKRIVLCGLLATIPLLAHAGQGKPSFEVASIKPNISPGPGDRRFTLSGVNIRWASLLDLITIAYEMPYSRVTAADPRTREMLAARYDVAATAAQEVMKDQLLIMLQTLLADRFRLTL